MLEQMWLEQNRLETLFIVGKNCFPLNQKTAPQVSTVSEKEMELLREINSNQSVRLVSGDQSIFVFL
jgi:hypothetical protein